MGKTVGEDPLFNGQRLNLFLHLSLPPLAELFK